MKCPRRRTYWTRRRSSAPFRRPGTAWFHALPYFTSVIRVEIPLHDLLSPGFLGSLSEGPVADAFRWMALAGPQTLFSFLGTPTTSTNSPENSSDVSSSST